MKYTRTIMITGMAALLATGASAANDVSTISAAKNMSSGDEVTVTGTVENFDSRHPFTLRDTTGTISVDLSSAKPIVLTNGEKVTITGDIDKGLLTTDLNAIDVKIETSVGEKIGSAIDSITGQTPGASAQTVSIQSLPNAGLVKLNGVVDSVDGAKKFTLKDGTGSVDVTITSSQSASLRKGTEVTVIGNVDKGLLGKSIAATEVDVQSSTATVATQP